VSIRIIKAYGGTITLIHRPGARAWLWQAFRPARWRYVWGQRSEVGAFGRGASHTRRGAIKAAVRAVR
jgi:hypothetical protein